MPGAGTFKSLANRDGMWNTAETLWYLTEGGKSDASIDYGEFGQPISKFGDDFVNWSRKWLADPVKVLQSYQPTGGIAARAQKAATDLKNFERDMSSVYGQPFLDWAGANAGANIDDFFEKAAEDKLVGEYPQYRQYLIDPNSATQEQIKDFEDRRKEHIAAAKEEYGSKLTNVAVFHPAFSGSTRGWRNGYRIPNTIGMDPYQAQAITRVLDQLADTMMEGGATYGDVMLRLNAAPVGRNVGYAPIKDVTATDPEDVLSLESGIPSSSFKGFQPEDY